MQLQIQVTITMTTDECGIVLMDRVRNLPFSSTARARKSQFHSVMRAIRALCKDVPDNIQTITFGLNRQGASVIVISGTMDKPEFI